MSLRHVHRDIDWSGWYMLLHDAFSLFGYHQLNNLSN